MVKQLQTAILKGDLTGWAKSAERFETLVDQAWRARAGHGAPRRRKPTLLRGLHVFKSIEAILWQPIMSIGRRTRQYGSTASARQYGL
jgi:hypothetical protein